MFTVVLKNESKTKGFMKLSRIKIKSRKFYERHESLLVYGSMNLNARNYR